MNSMCRKSIASFVSLSVLLVGCATQPAVPTSPGLVKVEYSRGTLKETPTEVTIVRRENKANQVAGQIALGLLMFALVGGTGFQDVDKEMLLGSRIEDPNASENLKNPVSGEFVLGLQEKVAAFVKQNPELKSKSFQHPIVVSGGSARLIYEAFSDDDQRFRLRNDLTIYKRRENAKRFSFDSPGVHVSCVEITPEPRIEAEWAVDGYRPVRTTLDDWLKTCENKVLAKLPELLKD